MRAPVSRSRPLSWLGLHASRALCVRRRPRPPASCRSDQRSEPLHPRRPQPHRNPDERLTRPPSPQPPRTRLKKGREARWANDTDGFALGAQPDKSRGRPMKARLYRPSSNERPAQHAFSLRALSRSPDPHSAETWTTASERHSHAPKRSSGRTRPHHARRPQRGLRFSAEQRVDRDLYASLRQRCGAVFRLRVCAARNAEQALDRLCQEP
jgi:hypothetical protein